MHQSQALPRGSLCGESYFRLRMPLFVVTVGREHHLPFLQPCTPLRHLLMPQTSFRLISVNVEYHIGQIRRQKLAELFIHLVPNSSICTVSFS